MKFAGLQRISLIDFPDRIATVLFTPGCNLRCPFCHNWKLVLDPTGPFLSEKDVLQILESRKRFVDAIVITGGEPTLHSDFPLFFMELKQRGFIIKLDTNGFFPEIIERSLPYLDYIALDIKTDIDRYQLLGAQDVSPFLQTIEILKQGSIDYEFRCTVVPGFIDHNNISKIGSLVKGAKRFALQQFSPRDTLDKKFSTVKPYSLKVISAFAQIIKEYVDQVILRI